MNIFFHNEDLQGMEEYLQELLELGVDAIIVSDPGIIRIAREKVPDLPGAYQYTGKYYQLVRRSAMEGLRS